jgi:hypothetical protein
MEIIDVKFPIYGLIEPHPIDPIAALPELNFYYYESDDRRCPRGGMKTLVCFWEGDITLTLGINGHIIELNNHDERNGFIHEIVLGRYKYTFQGIMDYPYHEDDLRLRVRVTRERI